ncbi:MAG TPA: hypothetical protein VJ995_00400 [Geothermobacteraceae bacterium]|nr:hypothetical protein [Geothermobacteraceae bacterium]
MGSQKGKIRSAKLETSDRLKRVLSLLQDGRWHGTRDILMRADVCAVNTAIAELRDNGFTIESRCAGRGRYEYQLQIEAQRSLW